MSHFLFYSTKTAWLATFLPWTYDPTLWLKRTGKSRPTWRESGPCSLLCGAFADVALLSGSDAWTIVCVHISLKKFWDSGQVLFHQLSWKVKKLFNWCIYIWSFFHWVGNEEAVSVFIPMEKPHLRKGSFFIYVNVFGVHKGPIYRGWFWRCLLYLKCVRS